MSELPGISVVVCNYNYAQFVGAAIDSALAQDYSRCEVIVVDDGSTDGSQEVIERYRDRTRVILLPTNRGQVAALNDAWPLAQYEIVMFLDSDDLLEPHAASTIARNWRADVVKVQFPMKTIDAKGKSRNSLTPGYLPNVPTDTLRRMLLKFGTCYGVAGSGNAYARRMLDKLSPISGLMWMDTILAIHAPFYGDVLTLSAPLVSYRIHEAQWSSSLNSSASRFIRLLEMQEATYSYLSTVFGRMGLTFDPEFARAASQSYVGNLISASRLSTPGERWYVPPSKAVKIAFRAAFVHSPHPVKRRAAQLMWTIAVALAPQRSVRRLIELRSNASSWPTWLVRLAS
jgi:glycosyltransferase involved in cell wall biosynthesis